MLIVFLAWSPACSYAQGAFIATLPEPGIMVNQSPAFVPVLVKGLIVHPDKPLNFEFVVDSGNDSADLAVIKEQSARIAKYFLAAVTVPEDQLWVNLSPYEKDRVIENDLGETVLGRDMLAQDYLLKQLTASLVYPEKGLGKEFWAKVYAEAQAKFGTTNIPVDTFNKVWIMPAQAEVFEKGNAVYVTDAKLKVMLDSDRTAMANKGPVVVSDEKAALTRTIMREVVLPAIEKEVNQGRNFAMLRQIYNAAILAKWYRERIEHTLLADAYVGKNLVSGVVSDEKMLKEEIYQRYIAAYKKGVFDYIKEEADTANGEKAVRKYFSGGISDLAMKDMPLARTADPSVVDRSATGKVFLVDLAMGQPVDAAMNIRSGVLAAAAIGILAAGLQAYDTDYFGVRSPFVKVAPEFVQPDYFYVTELQRRNDSEVLLPKRMVVEDINGKLENGGWELETGAASLLPSFSSYASPSMDFQFKLTNKLSSAQEIGPVLLTAYDGSGNVIKEWQQNPAGQFASIGPGQSVAMTVSLPLDQGPVKQIAVVVLTRDKFFFEFVVVGVDKLFDRDIINNAPTKDHAMPPKKQATPLLVASPGLGDPVMARPGTNGGIDIQNIDLGHKAGRSNNTFNDDAVRGVLKNGFNGFMPLIIHITPVQSVLPLLGLSVSASGTPAA